MERLLPRKRVFACYLMTMVLLLVQSASAAVDEKTIKKYISVFSGGSVAMQLSACKKLEWAGISDTRVFDLVEKQLLVGYQSNLKEKAEYHAWLAKALVFSGQEKYRDTLNKVIAGAGHKTVRKHAKRNLKNLEKYGRWNSIISDVSQFDSSVSVKINQYANMLKSGDRELQIVGAKRINYEQLFTNKFLLNIIDEQVKKSYLLDQSDKQFVNAVAHMSKMLAASGMAKYRATVENIASNAPNKKLRKHAAKYLKKY